MKRAAVLALAAGLATLVGCRILPHDGPPELDVESPDEWSALEQPGDGDSEDGSSEDGEPQEFSRWWDAFDEPDLAAAIAESLEHNRDLAAAAARVDAAAAQARIVGADLYPAVGLNGNAVRQQQVFVGLPVGGGAVPLQSLSTSYGLSLDMSWEIDLWGRIRAAKDSSLAALAATSGDYLAARQSIAAQTAKIWIALQEARLQEELSVRTAESFRRNARVVRRRYDGGVASGLDVFLAESDLASSEALLESREEIVERTQRQLEILLGRYPAGKYDTPVGLPEAPPTPPPGLPSEMLRRRPDVLAAEQRLKSADDRLYEARASLYPSLSLTASGGRVSSELDDLVKGDFTVWSLAGNFFQPLFQGGRLIAGVDLAKAGVRETLELYAAKVLLAFSEVETALAIEDNLVGREEWLEVATAQSQAAADRAEQRYSVGLEELIVLLQAQRRALENESALLEVRRERLEARIDLHLALGGDFVPGPAEPADPDEDRPEAYIEEVAR